MSFHALQAYLESETVSLLIVHLANTESVSLGHYRQGYSEIFQFKVVGKHNTLLASRVAQWERAGPITQRSMDRNHSLL